MTSNCTICGHPLHSGDFVASGICFECSRSLATLGDASIPALTLRVWGERRAPIVGFEPSAERASDSERARWLPQLNDRRTRVEACPDDVRSWLWIAEISRRLGDRTEARSAMKKSVDLYNAGGFVLKAVAVARTMIRDDIRDIETRIVAARLYAALGYWVRARAEAMMALHLSWPAPVAGSLELILEGLTREERDALREALGR